MNLKYTTLQRLVVIIYTHTEYYYTDLLNDINKPSKRLTIIIRHHHTYYYL